MGLGVWLWWIAGGGLVSVGLVVLIWALATDRSRGRRRCPRCWYDMSATAGLACPECGGSARRERALFRTRRHWRLAAVGAMVVFGGVAVVLAPAFRTEVWRRHVPDAVLIATMPRTGTQVSSPLWFELNRRLLAAEPGCGAEWYAGLSGWEKRLLLSRCRVALRDPSSFGGNHVSLSWRRTRMSSCGTMRSRRWRGSPARRRSPSARRTRRRVRTATGRRR